MWLQYNNLRQLTIDENSEDEPNGAPVNGVRRSLQLTEDSDPSSVFDSVFMSMSDTLNSINTLESSDQTPDDKPQNTTADSVPLAQPDTTRESDQLSVSSSSSVGGPSPRDRRCLPNDSSAAGIYLPMAPLSSSLHSPASNSKVSPTPPKKPPQTQPLRLADAPTDPDVSVGGLHFGPEQLRVSVHGRRSGAPQPHRPGAAAETSRATASRGPEAWTNTWR
ncbi:hypothetical protein K0M31_010184 [Melipona bicolor]|uniref:Uncharacterized protein n=1 Tax=Melipona bicolor TaxID=60889 RepID=A0AA40FME5_9HYME|nr:hypothetical protein K0M31_010184 [Melipona bicolor]